MASSTVGGERRAITIRRAVGSDALALAELAEASFVETFGPDNTAEDMAAYVAGAFGETVQGEEIADPRLRVLVAELPGHEELAGYAMLRDAGPETPLPVTAALERRSVPVEGAMEIARLYAARRWLGAGVGSALMKRSLEEAASAGRRIVWLGVWERNARAIAFYERWGFVDVGSHAFLLGGDRQTDRLMMRPIEG